MSPAACIFDLSSSSTNTPRIGFFTRHYPTRLMDQEFQPFYPAAKKMTSSKGKFTESKYNWALQNIIFYAVHTSDGHTLSYYKEGQVALAQDCPESLRFIASEFENIDFHIRFWSLREFVANANRENPACQLSFTEQTYRDLDCDLAGAEEEVDYILGNQHDE